MLYNEYYIVEYIIYGPLYIIHISKYNGILYSPFKWFFRAKYWLAFKKDYHGIFMLGAYFIMNWVYLCVVCAQSKEFKGIFFFPLFMLLFSSFSEKNAGYFCNKENFILIKSILTLANIEKNTWNQLI